MFVTCLLHCYNIVTTWPLHVYNMFTTFLLCGNYMPGVGVSNGHRQATDVFRAERIEALLGTNIAAIATGTLLL